MLMVMRISTHHIGFINIGFMNILGECKKYNLNIIYASSSSVYGDSKQFPLSEREICKKPLSLYGASKLFNELYFNSR